MKTLIIIGLCLAPSLVIAVLCAWSIYLEFESGGETTRQAIE